MVSLPNPKEVVDTHGNPEYSGSWAEQNTETDMEQKGSDSGGGRIQTKTRGPRVVAKGHRMQRPLEAVAEAAWRAVGGEPTCHLCQQHPLYQKKITFDIVTLNLAKIVTITLGKFKYCQHKYWLTDLVSDNSTV